MAGTKLLPCPFCGGEAELTGFNAPEYWVWCPSCKASTGAHTGKENAIEAWNTRAERTCKVIEMHEHVTMDEPDIAELSCGHDIMVFDMEPPNYCPNCGAKVVSE